MFPEQYPVHQFEMDPHVQAIWGPAKAVGAVCGAVASAVGCTAIAPAVAVAATLAMAFFTFKNIKHH